MANKCSPQTLHFSAQLAPFLLKDAQILSACDQAAAATALEAEWLTDGQGTPPEPLPTLLATAGAQVQRAHSRGGVMRDGHERVTQLRQVRSTLHTALAC